MTGVLATICGDGNLGQMDYIEWINDQGGLLDGVEIETLWLDTAGLTTRDMMAYMKFVEADALLVFIWPGTSVEPLKPKIARDEVPVLYAGHIYEGVTTGTEAWIFSGGPGWVEELSIVLEWARDNWDEARPLRLGYLQWDSTEGWIMGDALPELAAEIGGIELVGREVVPRIGVIDVTTELMRLENKDPDWLFTFAYGATNVVLANDIIRLGLPEKGIQICQALNGIDGYLLDVVGGDLEGWRTIMSYPLITDPEVVEDGLVLELGRAYRGWDEDEVSTVYLHGVLYGMYMLEGVRGAMETVGFENLDGRAMRNALASITGFETGFTAPINVSDSRPYFEKYERLYEVQGGQLRPISDWIEPTYPFVIE